MKENLKNRGKRLMAAFMAAFMMFLAVPAGESRADENGLLIEAIQQGQQPGQPAAGSATDSKEEAIWEEQRLQCWLLRLPARICRFCFRQITGRSLS